MFYFVSDAALHASLVTVRNLLKPSIHMQSKVLSHISIVNKHADWHLFFLNFFFLAMAATLWILFCSSYLLYGLDRETG